MDNAVALAALALTGTIATGFFAVINKQNKIHEKVADSMNRVAKSNDKIAEATRQGNKEAKERNGHLAELVIQQGENIKAVADAATDKVIDAVQHIEKQRVDHQIIKEVTHVPDRDTPSK